MTSVAAKASRDDVSPDTRLCLPPHDKTGKALSHICVVLSDGDMRRIGYCISANVWIDQLRRWELDLLPSGSKPGVQVQLGEKSLLSKSEELKAVSIAASTVFVPKLSRDSHRTTIIIAHRLSTIRAANEILVMRDGRIVERGAHHDLVVIGEFFAELIGHQSAGAVGIAISAAC